MVHRGSLSVLMAACLSILLNWGSVERIQAIARGSLDDVLPCLVEALSPWAFLGSLVITAGLAQMNARRVWVLGARLPRPYTLGMGLTLVMLALVETTFWPTLGILTLALSCALTLGSLFHSKHFLILASCLSLVAIFVVPNFGGTCPTTPNSRFRNRVDQMSYQLTQAIANTSMRYPASSEDANRLLPTTLYGGDILNEGALPRTPWGGKQAALLPLCRHLGPIDNPTPIGTVLGKAHFTSAPSDCTHVGAVIYAVDPSGERAMLYGIGERAGVAVVTIATICNPIQPFEKPRGVAVDKAGNLYVSDDQEHRIRILLPGGESRTFGYGVAGYADGVGIETSFDSPNGLVVDDEGTVYVADSGNHRIRRIRNGTVDTFAGGAPGHADGERHLARFLAPTDVALATDGTLYVADSGNHCIRLIKPDGRVSTLAGGEAGYRDAKGTAARFRCPEGLTVDGMGNVYLADTDNRVIRKVTAAGNVSTLAGTSAGYADGPARRAKFYRPTDVVRDPMGNLFVSDSGNACIRRIDRRGMVSTFVGGTPGSADGQGGQGNFRAPERMAIDREGRLVVVDRPNARICRITPEARVTTLSRNDNPDPRSDYAPRDLAVDAAGNLYVADQGIRQAIRRIDRSGRVETLAGGTKGFADGKGAAAKFEALCGLTVDRAGNVFAVDGIADSRVRRILPDGTVETIIGRGGHLANKYNEHDAWLYDVFDVALDQQDNLLVLKRFGIWRVESNGGVDTLLETSDLANRGMSPLYDFAMTRDGQWLVAAGDGQQLWSVAPTGVTQPLFGRPAPYRDPEARAPQKPFRFTGDFSLTRIVVDGKGTVFGLDALHHRVVRISHDGTVQVLAGGTEGYADGKGQAAKFRSPSAIALSPEGHLLVCDDGNGRIRRVLPDGTVSTLQESGL